MQRQSCVNRASPLLRMDPQPTNRHDGHGGVRQCSDDAFGRLKTFNSDMEHVSALLTVVPLFLPLAESTDSLSGSVGGVSTLRAETPVNSGGHERMELMATLSRISHMPIHNSFMPVDNPLYLDHTRYATSVLKPVDSRERQ